MLIPGYPNYEFVEGKGIYSLNFRQSGERRLMKTRLNSDGYPYIMVSRHSHSKVIKLHRIAAEYYMGQCPEGYVVNHKNSDRTDWSRENLEYVTLSENMSHSFRMGREVMRGERHGKSKLKESQVREIKQRILNGERNRDIVKDYPVDKDTISRIRTGYLWNWVTL